MEAVEEPTHRLPPRLLGSQEQLDPEAAQWLRDAAESAAPIAALCLAIGTVRGEG